jgi:hypothetical protein
MRPSRARTETVSVAPIYRSKRTRIIAIATDIESSTRRLSPRRPVSPSAGLGRSPCRELPRETPGLSATKPTTSTGSVKACLRVRHQADRAQPARTQAQAPGWTQQRGHSKRRKVERLFALDAATSADLVTRREPHFEKFLVFVHVACFQILLRHL